MVTIISSTAYRVARRLARLRTLAEDRRGAAAIEFAFIAAPLAALMIAILQTSMVFFAQQTLETTTERAVRQLITGSAQQSGLSAAQFKTNLCTKLPAFMKCANVMVDVRTVTAFSDASVSSPALTFDGSGQITNTWSFTPGGAGTINVATVMYVWNVQKGPLGFDLATMSSNRRLLFATSVFKVEPYTS